MKALVTGSTGFIGRRLCAMLTERGDTVVVARRGDDHFRIMRDAKPDVVFHLAGAYVRDHRPVDVANLVQSNIEYGAMILEAMRMHSVPRIVAASSLWALEYPAVNLYAACKCAFEPLLEFYSARYGIDDTILYLGDTYGPEDRRGKIVYRMLEAAILGVELSMTPGEQIIDLVHVDDVCAGLLQAAALPGRNRYGLPGERVRLTTLADHVQIATGKRLTIAWGALPYHVNEVMSPEHAHCLPGWKPARSLHEWLVRLAKGI